MTAPDPTTLAAAIKCAEEDLHLQRGIDDPEVNKVRALVAAASAYQVMREALEFYAEQRRYNGPNQNNPGDDPHTPPDAPYFTDVTRDGGERARAAIEKATKP